MVYFPKGYVHGIAVLSDNFFHLLIFHYYLQVTHNARPRKGTKAKDETEEKQKPGRRKKGENKDNGEVTNKNDSDKGPKKRGRKPMDEKEKERRKKEREKEKEKGKENKKEPKKKGERKTKKEKEEVQVKDEVESEEEDMESEKEDDDDEEREIEEGEIEEPKKVRYTTCSSMPKRIYMIGLAFQDMLLIKPEGVAENVLKKNEVVFKNVKFVGDSSILIYSSTNVHHKQINWSFSYNERQLFCMVICSLFPSSILRTFSIECFE